MTSFASMPSASEIRREHAESAEQYDEQLVVVTRRLSCSDQRDELGRLEPEPGRLAERRSPKSDSR